MWYKKSAESIIKELETDIKVGLTNKEVRIRLAKYGYNTFPPKKQLPIIFKFFGQFKDILVLILLGATFISLVLGDMLDALAIFAIVILNATIGFIQEIQAEKTLESLKQKDILYATVLRDKKIEKIPFSEIVKGDILMLVEGAKIPADARIIQSFSLHIDESILTGESIPVTKNAEILRGVNFPLADRVNMVFADTKVVSGRGIAVVVATGVDTEIGKIATYLEKETFTKSPLTVDIEKVGRTLTIVIGIIAFFVFIVNFLSHTPLIESLLIAISLAVAAIPEGLPAIVTIVLSLGVKRLAQKKSIIKKLASVETLGAIHIIATDKTGTLTQNKISVTKIILRNGSEFKIEGVAYKSNGTFFNNINKVVNPLNMKDLGILLKAGVIANNATVTQTGEVIGDTTEASLIVAALRADMNLDEIKTDYPKIFEAPFTSERKMMSVIVKVDDTGDYMMFAKGAPEVMIPLCIMDKDSKDKMLSLTQNMATQGLRSLVIAQKLINSHDVKKALEEETVDENSLQFLGIVGMQDPIREEIYGALQSAKMAGIRTIMITGDHKETARAIAFEAGIINSGDQVLTENEISKLSIQALSHKIQNGVNVFARISPMGKLRIIEAIKLIPNTKVAVTGDGVNDAPALKASHIGIAMGLSGTDITREVADMVITDDNYATIIEAVKEGRIIFANLIKFIRYLISCNLSEVIVVSGGIVFGTPLPLLPIQLLWINLITDGLPALALGVDPPEFDVMKRPPRSMTEGILHKKRWIYMLIEGSVMGISVFGLYIYALYNFSYVIAQTMTFAALALSQLVHAFNNRSSRTSLFKLGLFSNKYLVGTAILSIIVQIMAIQTNFGNMIFKTIGLNTNNWTMVILVSLIPFLVVEIKKQLRFRILP